MILIGLLRRESVEMVVSPSPQEKEERRLR